MTNLLAFDQKESISRELPLQTTDRTIWKINILLSLTAMNSDAVGWERAPYAANVIVCQATTRISLLLFFASAT
jgi:hypothetical protein